jgi:two-component system nitrate/nitrite response regulator NarL
LSDPKSRHNKIRVLVADNSSVHTQLLADALRREPSFEITAFDSDSRGLASATVNLETDVLVVSTSLDGHPARGLEVLRYVRVASPNVRTVVLMESLTDEDILSAFRAGARGLFGKSQPVQLLSKCVRSVHEGQIWADKREISIALDSLLSGPTVGSLKVGGMSLLSKRELEVVHCLAEGLTNREIAKRLKLSQHTVKNHLFRVFDKLGVSNRIELLFMALRQVDSNGVTAKDAWSGSTPSKFEDELAALKKDAEAGVPSSQLALAQLYMARRSDPQDAVRAYTWYLVGLKRAAEAKELLTSWLTTSQIEEAEREASAKLSERDEGGRDFTEWSPRNYFEEG